MTSIVPRAAATPPPAPPAYRPPSYYEEAGRRRSPWPMILGIVAIGIAAVGGYLIYNKVTTAINKNAPVAVQNVEQLPVKNAETHPARSKGLRPTRSCASEQHDRGDPRDQPEPEPGRPRRQGHDRHADRLDRQAEDDRPGARRPAARAGRDDARERGPALDASTTSARARRGGLRDRVVPGRRGARPRRDHRPAQRLDRAEDSSASRRSSASSTRTPPSALKGAGLQGHPLGRRERRPGRPGRRAEPGRRVGGLARLDDHALGLDGPAAESAVPSVTGDDQTTATQLLQRPGSPSRSSSKT